MKNLTTETKEVIKGFSNFVHPTGKKSIEVMNGWYSVYSASGKTPKTIDEAFTQKGSIVLHDNTDMSPMSREVFQVKAVTNDYSAEKIERMGYGTGEINLF